MALSLGRWHSRSKAGKVYDNCFRSVAKISIVRLEKNPSRQLLVQAVASEGSGFVWDRDLRLLVTCDHVIRNVSEFRTVVSVTLEDESDGIVIYEAEVVFSDWMSDVAVLRVNAPKDKLWPLTAGDSNRVLIGDEVFAIGTPFGHQNSLSAGIISGLNRTVNLRQARPCEIRCSRRGLFQTDAAINPGNSGGPLLDIHSKVIGMNTCINASPSGTSTGVGFAIPVNKIREIIDKEVKGKSANDTEPNSGTRSLPYTSGLGNTHVADFVNGGCVGVRSHVIRAPYKPFDSAVLSRLQQFSAMNKVKKMALHVIVWGLSKEEIGGLTELFRMFDADNSGTITFDELKDGLKRGGYDLMESEIKDIMDGVDIDGSGAIDYDEFIAATVHLNTLEREKNLRLAFYYFDKNSVYITIDEIHQACKKFGLDDVHIDDMVQEIDHNKDGRVYYGEFVAMMRKGNGGIKSLDSTVLSRLKQFSAMDKLKRMALCVIVEDLSKEEIGGLEELFRMFDTDNSGTITFDELKDGLKREGYDLMESEIKDLMAGVDIDGSGAIDYDEFIAATVPLNTLEREKNLRLAFYYFDKGQSGYITIDEMQRACKNFGLDDVHMDDMIKEIDQDKDGRIDYGEFVAMMREGYEGTGR